MLIILVGAALIILVIVSFKYPQIALILFLTAGLIKATLMLKFSFFRVVDYTVLCAVLLLIAMTYNFIRRGSPFKDVVGIPLGIYLLLSVLLLLGIGYTSAPNYGFQKSSRFATLGLIAFLAPIFFVDKLKDIKLVMGVLLSVGIVLSVVTIIAPQAAVIKTYETARGTFLEANPLDTATRAGTAAIIAFCFAVMAHTSKPLRIFSLTTICVILVGMIYTQSRGPFVAMVFTWLAALFICRRGILRGWLPFIVGAIVIAMMITLIRLPENITSRITRLWSSPYYRKEASLERTSMFVWALRKFPERPVIGHGTGAWSVDRGYGDIRLYPHNIVLELLYEQGLVGASLFIFLIWYIFRRWRWALRDTYLFEGHLHSETFQLVQISGLIFLFTLLEAMVSYDINGNRLMFFCGGLVLALYNCIGKMTEQVYEDMGVTTEDWQQLGTGDLQDAQILY